MVTLRIDEETYAALARRAAAEGMSVEDWLRNATVQESRAVDASNEEDRRTWHERFEAYLATCRPTGFPMDDSRESIYE